MRKKSKALFFLAFILSAVLFLAQAQAGEEEEFPEWVPKEAIEAAKKGLSSFVDYAVQVGSVYYKDEEIKKEDLEGCTIKYPYEIVKVDCENYIKGEKIQNKFSPPPTTERAIGFRVCLGNKYIGDISARKYKDGNWQYFVKGYAGLNTEDYFKEVFKPYLSKHYKIYNADMSQIYFIELNGKIIDEIEYRGKEWVHNDPEEMMIRAREGTRKYLRLRKEGLKNTNQ